MNPDDPKLTAYALDELAPAERAEIEQLLRENPDALAEVEETKTFAARLRSELKAEAAAPLTEEQKATVLAAADGQPEPFKIAPPQSRRWLHRWLPIAAGIVILAGLGALTIDPLIQQKSARSASEMTASQVPALDEKRASTPPPQFVPLDAVVASAPGASFELSSAKPTAEVALALPPPPFANAAGTPVPSADPLPLFARSNAVSPSLSPASRPEESAESQGKVMPSKSFVLENEGRLAGPGETPALALSDLSSIAPAPLATPRPFTQAVSRDGTTSAGQSAALPGGTLTLSGSGTLAAGNKALESDRRRGAVPATAIPASVPAQPGTPARVALKNDTSRNSPREVAPGLDFDSAFAGGTGLDPSFGNTEAYDAITDNAFLAVRENPLSTFSIDVDTASYANVRRFLNAQTRPPKGAVRIEELLNYFTYDYPQPAGDAPFSATMEVAACPWTPEHRLVRIGLKGREIARDKRPASNLVFLIDVSGSMQPENKLPLLKQSLALLVDQLSPEDTVAIAVYAGASGTVLEPTRDRAEIRAALDRLASGGSTNGGAGIQLAYRLAEQSFIKGGVNRVILATDGDFNVGVTSQSELTDLITRKAKTGVFLTVLGFGMGNLKDSTLEKLADKGNGNYAYIDTLNEGRKVLVEQMNGTLVTIAKDVKIQVEFNPAQVASYRLIGYENRLLAKEDFNDDRKDAGEIGAGHTVTALYEVVPAGVKPPNTPAVDQLKYQPRATPPDSVGRVRPFATPEDAFLGAYQMVQRAERAEQDGRRDEARSLFRNAAKALDEIAQAHSDWQPGIVSYRQQRTREALARLGENQGPQTATAAAPSITNPAQAEQQLIALKPAATTHSQSVELLTLKLRYKQPDGDVSKLLEFPLTDGGATWEKSSRDFRFAAAVAGFGMLLRDSPYRGAATWETVRELAVEGQGEDRSGYRAEFLTLLDKAKALGR